MYQRQGYTLMEAGRAVAMDDVEKAIDKAKDLEEVKACLKRVMKFIHV